MPFGLKLEKKYESQPTQLSVSRLGAPETNILFLRLKHNLQE